jgi:molecular chaperone GrpE
MNETHQDDMMLGRFRHWLGQTRREADALSPEPAIAAEPLDPRGTGLLQVVEEFTALRHEVKLQTKSARGMSERTEQTLIAMQEAMELFRSLDIKEKEIGQRAAKPLVESLMDLDEALGRGRAVIDTARRRLLEDLAGRLQEQLDGLLAQMPFWSRRLHGPWRRRAREIINQRLALDYREIFDSMAEGYELILARLQRAMRKAELYRIECVGRQVDPNLMTVVDVVDDPMRPPGLVIEQIRPGYYWKNKVLRFAEVRAVQGRTAS